MIPTKEQLESADWWDNSVAPSANYYLWDSSLSCSYFSGSQSKESDIIAVRPIIELVSKVDLVNNPVHYKQHPSGIECIQITEHMGFNLGNAVKYIWRCDEKHDAIEDLEKAEFYIKREINKRKKIAGL